MVSPFLLSQGSDSGHVVVHHHRLPVPHQGQGNLLRHALPPRVGGSPLLLPASDWLKLIVRSRPSLFEGGLIPDMILLLSYFYTSTE